MIKYTFEMLYLFYLQKLLTLARTRTGDLHVGILIFHADQKIEKSHSLNEKIFNF